MCSATEIFVRLLPKENTNVVSVFPDFFSKETSSMTSSYLRQCCIASSLFVIDIVNINLTMDHRVLSMLF